MAFTLANVIDDAEKIAPELVPTTATLDKVVGVLAQHLAEFTGKELPHLADEALGIAPPPEEGTPEQTPAEKLAAAEAEVAALRGQVQTPGAGEAGSGVTSSGAAA